MAASLNKIQLIGNLGADPETRYLPSGDAVTNIRIATTESWKDKSGERQEHTEWHRISFFGQLAEIAGEHLKKGAQCYIEGRIRTRKWRDKEGQDKYSTEVIADRMLMLGGRPQGAAPGNRAARPASPAGAPPAAKPGGGGSFDDMDDDIPY